MFLLPPCVADTDIIFLPCDFYLISLFSSPNLSGRKLDVYHTSTRSLSANLECMSQMCCTRLAENTGRKNRHFGTIARLCRAISLQLRHVSTIGKNLLSRNMSSTCPRNMVNFGLLKSEIGWSVWGTPTNFNGFRVLQALLHGTVIMGVSQTLRRWTQGATYIRQGGHHVGHIILSRFIMAAVRSRCGHYIFLLFPSSFFPRLISAVADWMSTILLHNGVALVRI